MFTVDKEKLLICPYDSNHQVKPSKFAIHLIKCAKTSTKILEICPYNSFHRIPPELMAAHLTECPDSNAMVKRVLEENAEAARLARERDAEQAREDEDAAELARRIQTFKINDPQPSTSTVHDDDDPDGWNVKPKRMHMFAAPGLGSTSPSKPEGIVGQPTFSGYGMMKPKTRKQISKKLLEETEERRREREMAPILAAQAEKEQKEYEKRLLEKKAEEERLEQARKQREITQKSIAEKKKAKKAKEKAAKREVFLASEQAQSQASTSTCEPAQGPSSTPTKGQTKSQTKESAQSQSKTPNKGQAKGQAKDPSKKPK